jgi:Coenzyme PQQ synthesis protein D (PqqD)
MDKLPDAFSVNRDDVAAKVIDGEVIIIRLSDGTYYSMDNVGTQVWSLLEALGSPAAVIQTIAAWFGAPIARVQNDVDALVRDLLAEGLIVPAAVTEGRRGEVGSPPELATYESPRLNIHRDMGNLLALDPPTPGIDDLLLRADADESR